MLRSSERIHTVGWFTASCLLVSNIIGGGIFTTTGLMARDLGDPMLILLLWTMGGLFAIGGAMVYGELGSRLPHAGGDYVYLREAYGPLVAFLSGWTSFTIGFGAAASCRRSSRESSSTTARTRSCFCRILRAYRLRRVVNSWTTSVS